MSRVRMPADVEREDKLLAGLTARQLIIIGVPGLGLWLVHQAVGHLVPPVAVVAAAVPVMGGAIAAALATRDGLSLDRLLLAALRFLRSPKRQSTDAHRGAPTPSWVNARTPALPRPLDLPVHKISDEGVLDLGEHGCAVLVSCSTVSFSLRTPAEQAGLVSGFGSYLNSLNSPVQILIRAESISLDPLVEALDQAAPAMPHPALEQAARDHADFLADLAQQRDLLRRHIVLIVRDTTSNAAHGTASARRRAEEAVRALAAAGSRAHILTGPQVAAVLSSAADPSSRHRPPEGLASPQALITGPTDTEEA
ncbi:PrgI family protein [Nocardiopsis nanhaiensis]